MAGFDEVTETSDCPLPEFNHEVMDFEQFTAAVESCDGITTPHSPEQCAWSITSGRSVRRDFR